MTNDRFVRPNEGPSRLFVICHLSDPSFRRGCLMADVTEILLDLIAIPSVSSTSNRPVIDYARDRLKPSQWELRFFPYTDPNGVVKVNLVAVPKKRVNGDGVELALVCHTDTVPYPDDWPEAVQPKVIDGRVFRSEEHTSELQSHLNLVCRL